MQTMRESAVSHSHSVACIQPPHSHLHPRTEAAAFSHDCETRPQTMTMSFLGKMRNLNSGPPAPPRRTEIRAGFEWPQEEFDDEDGDMYEVPPCERAPLKAPSSQGQENIYLERSSNPTAQQRGVTPIPPRPGKPPKPHKEELFSDSNSKKPPEIDRNDKPGRKVRPPPAAAPAPAAVPAAEDDDVYLDPNTEQEDNDVYLEPEAACPAPKRGPARAPPLSKPSPAPPKPTMKPSLRGSSTSVIPPMPDKKSSDERRASTPRAPPPTPGAKPPLPGNMKDPKPMPPVPPMADTKPAGGLRKSGSFGTEEKDWFAGDCSRKEAEELLQRYKKDGVFLIRHSSNQSSTQPYTLAMLYQQKVYNIPVRFLEETQSYALGKEGKKNEEVFSSLDEMVSYHRKNQILLIDSRSQAKHTANLTQAARS
ncbi:B-cell linker protein [Nothobranchius furzeri]|uniref:SH2 domain containing 6 n=1 Tax=Nothobranchius furzeri TaxID=105023 RepID=A0A1A7ZRR3_NOTFU